MRIASMLFGDVPQVEDGAAALVLVAVALLVDLRRCLGRVALRHGVEILQTLELVVPQLLPVNPESTQHP